MGYFPCSPVFLTLAVSLDMLELVSILFVHAAPNERAWATTITKYLKNCGHEFATREALRHRFSSALAQYQVLMQLVDGEMVRIVMGMEGMATVSALNDTTPVLEQEYANTQTLTAAIQDSVNNTLSSLHQEQECPSAHLCDACPLCFGGNIDPTVSGVNLIVCIDANFQLKRNRDKDR